MHTTRRKFDSSLVFRESPEEITSKSSHKKKKCKNKVMKYDKEWRGAASAKYNTNALH